MKAKYINPFTDFAFEKIFGEEGVAKSLKNKNVPLEIISLETNLSEEKINKL